MIISEEEARQHMEDPNSISHAVIIASYMEVIPEYLNNPNRVKSLFIFESKFLPTPVIEILEKYIDGKLAESYVRDQVNAYREAYERIRKGLEAKVENDGQS